MAHRNPKYEKPPGPEKTYVFGGSKIRLAPDHLLVVLGNGFTETYRRMYYGDIEALVIRRTSSHVVQSVLLGLTVLLTAGLAQLTEWNPIWWTVVAMLTALLLIVLARGPLCACHVQTRVQRQKLPQITRMKQALRLLDLLEPRITAAQGTVEPGAFEAAAATEVEQPGGRGEVQTTAGATAIHWAFFSLVLAEGLLTGLEMLWPRAFWTVFSLPVSLAVLTTLIITLIGESRHPVEGRVRVMTKLGLFHCVLGLVFGLLVGLIGGLDHAAQTPLAGLKAGIQYVNQGPLWVRIFQMTLLTTGVTVGALGLVRTARAWPKTGHR
jgi:hypothetical protein